MNEQMKGQNTGITEPVCTHGMARPGVQKWAGKHKLEKGCQADSQAQDEPGTLPDAMKITGLRVGQGARSRR